MQRETITIHGYTYPIDRVEWGQYVSNVPGKVPALTLWGDGEPITRPTVNLAEYLIFPAEGEAFVRDYEECYGVTDELVRLGIVEKIERITFGPWNTAAWRVRILKYNI